MNGIAELRTRRTELAERAQSLRDKTDRSTEENEQYDQTLTQIVEVDENIEREERHLETERRDAEFMRRNGHNPNPTNPAQRGGNPDNGDQPSVRTIRMRGEQVDDSGYRAFRDVQAYTDPDFVRWMAEARSQQLSSSNYNLRALQVDDDAGGGYLVRPEQFVARLIQAVDNQVFMRQLGTVFQLTEAASMGAPALATDLNDADWTQEIVAVTEDTALALGKRVLSPHYLSKLIKVSRPLLRLAALSADSIILERLAYVFGITMEKGYLTGTGAGQPLGVFTASADGVPTSRDVSTGNTTTSMQFDGLIEAKYTLKPQYWDRARWLFHRDGVKQIAKLKDGDGQYIWQPSVIAGQPDRILNSPLVMSEYAPNTFTTGLYVGMFADFSNYWIADALAMEIQRLVELYAVTNQVGIIGRMQTDGMPVLAEAFVRVKLA
jgi:HK97 family phage major capsid protein